MAKNYVYSTMAADVRYQEWLPSKDMPLKGKISVLISGGANVINKKTFVTPKGAVTEVSDEELAFLMQDPTFQLHMENGFISVEKRNADVDKVVKSMVGRDGSAQLTPETLPRGENEARMAG